MVFIVIDKLYKPKYFLKVSIKTVDLKKSMGSISYSSGSQTF